MSRPRPTSIDRRGFLKATVATGVAAPLITRYRGAHAQAQVTLRLHHFLPARSTAQAQVFEPWAKALADDSGGRIAVQMFPSMQLGGAPPQLFDQARDGVADIVWTLPGNTPGRFPSIEAFELPFMPGSALANSLALAEFGQKNLGAEFGEVHPLCFWAHDPGHIHTVDRKIERIEDLRGLKIRFPTAQCRNLLLALGADPVGMPIPQVPDALSKGTIDGTVIPWEVVPAIRVHEICKFHTTISWTPGLYSATFVLAMNKKRYETLPDDLRKIVDTHSGAALSKRAGLAWDAASSNGRAAAEKRSNTITELAPAERARWQAIAGQVTEAWVKTSGERKIDGARLEKEARELIRKYALQG